MDIVGRTIWQQAAGDTDRNYSDICLKWDVILNGPGHAGSWLECKEIYRSDGMSARKITDLNRFAEGMKAGDLVVLRLGTATVVGVGQIVGGYEWNDLFGDIDGWRLQHVRRVRWVWKGRKEFETYALKQGDTTQQLDQGSVTDWLVSLPVNDDVFPHPLVNLPMQDAAPDIDVTQISEFLFGHGVASGSITTLLNEIGELTRIAKWYQCTDKPSEHETVAYLVVPLLRALGWTPQRMAIEWKYVDVALFERLPREDETLLVVVEAKKMDNSCLSATQQAMSYTKERDACHRFIVTDGLRYGVYTRNTRNENDDFSLYAYLNLTRLRNDYPIYECNGAEEALLAMTPEWKPNEIQALQAPK